MMNDEDLNAGLIVAIVSLVVQVSQWVLSLLPIGRARGAGPIPTKSADVTVALTGVSATCYAGNLTPKIE